jgi:hypothetical protein
MFPDTSRSLRNRHLWSQNSWRILVFFMLFIVTFGVACKPNSTKKGPPKAFSGNSGKAGDGKGKGDDDDSPNKKDSDTNDGFLKDSDFPDTDKSLTRVEFVNLLSNPAIYAEVTEHFDAGSYSRGTPSGACAKENSAIEAKATDKNLTFELEDSKCSGNTPGTRSRAKGFSKYSCDKSAFAKMDGKKKSDLKSSPIAPLCSSSKLTFVKNYMFDTEADSNSNHPSFKSKRAFSKSDGSPCEVEVSKSSFKILSGCSYLYNLEVDENTGETIEVTFKGHYKSAEAQFDNPHFTKGSMEFTLNNWKGTITFNSRSGEYSATSSSGEKAAGVFK